MPTLKFIHATFPNPDRSKLAVMERLRSHKQALLAKRKGMLPPLDPDGAVDELQWQDLLHGLEIPWSERKKIERRAAAISQHHEAGSGLSHLKPAERERLEGLRDGVRLAAIPTEHHADELAAALHAEFPWMAPATEAVWQAMRRTVRCGEPGLRLPPLLLDGPPGIGKSHWARHLGTLLAVPSMVFEATVENASFGLVGSQRGWGNATPGRLLNTMLQHRIGNPVVIVDEVEKAGRASSNKGQSFGLAEALLPMLEPISARAWSCPFYEVKFDMGWVIWVLTSNNWRLLPEPLLSRCPPLRLRDLTLADLDGFVRREGARRGLSGAATEAICAALERAPARGQRPSLRVAIRMLQRADDLESAPVLH